MFELYFGAFDIVLYALAFIAAVMLSGGICDGLEADDPLTVSASISSAVAVPALTYVACAPSPQSTVAIAVDCPAAEVAIAETDRRLKADPSQPVLGVVTA